MRTMGIGLIAGVLGFAGGAVAAPDETLTIESTDGLPITLDIYRPTSEGDVAIVLFHQSGSSRGEYAEIAPRLSDLGYLAVAADARAGGEFGGIANETAKAAEAEGRPTAFADSRPDLDAAIAYTRDELDAGTVIGWGSSYSASLVLMIAGQTDLLDGALAFSPGEYFGAPDAVVRFMDGIEIPVLVTSAKGEEAQWSPLFLEISAPKTGFVPANGTGAHGSSALIPGRSDVPEVYWFKVEEFLAANFPVE